MTDSEQPQRVPVNETLLKISPELCSKLEEYHLRENFANQNETIQHILKQYLERDSDERKHWETEIRQSEARFRAQYMGIPIPTYTWQKKPENDDFTLIDINDAALIITKGRISEHLGKKASVYHQDMPEILEDLNRCYTKRIPIKREQLYTLKTTGEQKYLAVSYIFVPPDLVMIHTEDMTKRKQTEQSLLQSKMELELRIQKRTAELRAERDIAKTYLDLAGTMIFVIDTKRIITMINRKGCEILGRPEQEIIGQPIDSFMVEKHIGNAQSRFIDALSGNINTIEQEVESAIYTKSGEIRYITANNRVLTDNQENIIGVITAAEDITERKESENEIRQLTSAIEQSINGIAIMDIDSKLVYVNQAYAQMHGYTPDELIDQSTRTLHIKELQKKTPEIITQLLKDGTWSGETKRRRKDNSEFFTYMVSTLLKTSDETPTGYLTVVIDITAQKQIEKSLRKEQERAQKYLDVAGVILIAINKDGRIKMLNRKGCDILGYTEQEILNNPRRYYDIIIQPHMRDEEKDWFANVMNGELKLPETLENSVLTKLGKVLIISWHDTVLYDDNDNIIGLMSSGMDITEQKQAENALRESEYKYSTLVEQASNGVLIIQDNIYKFVNRSLAQLTGYSITEIIGMPYLSLISPDSQAIVAERTYRVLNGLDIPQIYEIQLLCKDGAIKDVEVSVGIIQYQNHSAMMVTTRDITEWKQMEIIKRELEQKRSEFISMTSHELRTPLTVIKGYEEILKQRFNELDEQQRNQCLNAIRKNVLRLERLIEGVSTFGQIDKGTFRLNIIELDFKALLTESVKYYKSRIGNQLEFVNFSVEDPILIEADEDRLLQIFENLIENAIHHTSKETRQIIIHAELKPNRVQVTISDNGAGILDTDIDRIFDQFVSIPTEHSIGGSGIGLYLSRNLIEAQGGSISVKSKGKGYGSTFIVELPRKI